jgi:uncharacterized protein YjbJ (UPF0337 family)
VVSALQITSLNQGAVMFPQFFMHKFREVQSVIQIIRGKLTGNPELRIKGVNNALKSMQDERKTYLQEKKEAEKHKLYQRKLQDENLSLN